MIWKLDKMGSIFNLPDVLHTYFLMEYLIELFLFRQKIETKSWGVVVNVDDVNDDFDVVPISSSNVVSSFDGQVMKR